MRISDWSSDVCSSDLAGGGDKSRSAERKGGLQGVNRVGWHVEGLEPLRRQQIVGDEARHPALGHLKPGVVHVERIEQTVLEEIVERSEERRVGKECVSTCRAWVSPDH